MRGDKGDGTVLGPNWSQRLWEAQVLGERPGKSLVEAMLNLKFN